MLPAVSRIHQCYSSLKDYHGHQKLQSLLLDCGFRQLIQEHDLSSDAYGIQYSIRPSTYFKIIHKYNYEAFVSVFGADREKLYRFWCSFFASADGQLYRQEHPQLIDQTPEQLSTCIPTVLHEDATPFTKAKAVSVLDWVPLLCSGSAYDTRFLVHSYIEQKGSMSWGSDEGWDDFLEDLDRLNLVFDT